MKHGKQVNYHGRIHQLANNNKMTVKIYKWDHRYDNGDSKSIEFMKSYKMYDLEEGQYYIVFSSHHKLYKSNMFENDVKDIINNFIPKQLGLGETVTLELPLMHRPKTTR